MRCELHRSPWKQASNNQHKRCIEKYNSSTVKKRQKMYDLYVKRQDRDYKNFQQKMIQTRNEMLKSKKIDFENMRVKFRAQLQQLELAQRNEQIQKERFLKNFDPTKSTNIEKVYFKIFNDSLLEHEVEVKTD